MTRHLDWYKEAATVSVKINNLAISSTTIWMIIFYIDYVGNIPQVVQSVPQIIPNNS
jgi:hypothetical protein